MNLSALIALAVCGIIILVWRAWHPESEGAELAITGMAILAMVVGGLILFTAFAQSSDIPLPTSNDDCPNPRAC